MYWQNNLLGGYKIWGGGTQDSGRKKNNPEDTIYGVDKHIDAFDFISPIGAGGHVLSGYNKFFKTMSYLQKEVSGFSGGVSLGGDENVQKGMQSIKRTLYNGYSGSKQIELTPEQNRLFDDYESERGNKLRDSIRGVYYYNASSK